MAQRHIIDILEQLQDRLKHPSLQTNNQNGGGFSIKRLEGQIKRS